MRLLINNPEQKRVWILGQFGRPQIHPAMPKCREDILNVVTLHRAPQEIHEYERQAREEQSAECRKRNPEPHGKSGIVKEPWQAECKHESRRTLQRCKL